VVVKARLVVLAKAAPGPTAAHLRYIQRDGVTPEGEPGRCYGPTADATDPTAFERRGRDDRHQFRFIVSPEDAAELGDLKGFTRQLMSGMEADLGMRLDWIAVDHFDTDNPHTHGMRARAAAIATDLLGPQTGQKLRERLARDVEAGRWTGLDRRLVERTRDGVLDVADAEAALSGRIRTLAQRGLAEPEGGSRWRLRADVETTLKAMSERSDRERQFVTRQRPWEGLIPGDADGWNSPNGALTLGVRRSA
jgi:type IV secretory pathway VirD2 relaxase